MSDSPTTFYFGCQNGAGHFLHDQHLQTVQDHRAGPWQDWELDGRLCPGFVRNYVRDREVIGEAMIHHKDGWTALAFWDNSIDERPGSNSVFVIEGMHDFEQAVVIAKAAFPQIWERFKFTVRRFPPV